MTPNRKPAKNTPSPATLRERVLRNCLTEIRSKRSSMVQQLRTQTTETRNELMKAFVSEIYSVTKRENHQPQLTVSDEMDQQQAEDEYLQSAEHRELLSQIADAIAFELEHQQEINSEEELFEMEEWEESARIEMLDTDDNTIICPLCRNAVMFISDEAGTASCPCGALINLHTNQTSSNTGSTCGSNPGSNHNSQEEYVHSSPGGSGGNNGGARSGDVISAAELKRRLGSVYDRHNAVCEQYHYHQTYVNSGVFAPQNGLQGVNRADLEYQIFGGHLCTYCAVCSFCEQVT